MIHNTTVCDRPWLLTWKIASTDSSIELLQFDYIGFSSQATFDDVAQLLMDRFLEALIGLEQVEEEGGDALPVFKAICKKMNVTEG